MHVPGQQRSVLSGTLGLAVSLLLVACWDGSEKATLVTSDNCAGLDASTVVSGIELAKVRIQSPGETWYFRRCTTEAGVVLVELHHQKGSSRWHTVLAAVGVEEISESESASLDGPALLEQLASRRADRGCQPDHPRCANFLGSWERASHAGAICAYSTDSHEDRGVPEREGDVFLEVNANYWCLEPAVPPHYLVYLNWSERTPPEADVRNLADRQREATKWLDQLEFR